MDLVHVWHDRLRAKVSLSSTLPTTHDLNIKGTDFPLHPPFQLIQVSYAVWWQLLLKYLV